MIRPSAYISENDTVHKMITYLEENYKHPIVLNDMAEYVGLSKEYMCSLFKSAMQQTIMHYLLELRIAQARILLIQYPEKTVKEISMMCGFESPSYLAVNLSASHLPHLRTTGGDCLYSKNSNMPKTPE